MKNIKLGIIALVIMFIGTSIFVACSSEEKVVEPNSIAKPTVTSTDKKLDSKVKSTVGFRESKEYLTIDVLLKKVTDLGDSKNKMVTFNIGFDKQKNLYILANLKVERDDFVIDFIKGLDPQTFLTMKRKVTITCTLSDGTTAQTTCNRRDGACIGTAVGTCLDAGGCAEVCTVGRYIP